MLKKKFWYTEPVHNDDVRKIMLPRNHAGIERPSLYAVLDAQKHEARQTRYLAENIAIGKKV